MQPGTLYIVTKYSCSKSIPGERGIASVPESETLRAPEFHILLALGTDALHGYAIMQRFADANAEAGGQRLLPGTLYTSIARMIEDGLLEEVASTDLSPEATRDSRRRLLQGNQGRPDRSPERSRTPRAAGQPGKAAITASG